jgi:hypothetical protein
MTLARLAQGSIETLGQADPRARVTQAEVEAASPRHARSQAHPGSRRGAESGQPGARLSHTAVEVLNQVAPAARIAQAAVEVLSSSMEAAQEDQPVIFVCTRKRPWTFGCV